ncbi:MAG: hypothetical protein C0476_10010 [Sphingomonas sp.]|nr:hypothetical protein [Sphingomonas sp.]
MFDWRSPAEWRRLWRYYQAGILNLLFGFGLFALFLSLGVNVYVAQTCAHLLGMTFNYFTYSRYTFNDNKGSKFLFFISYIVNYFINIGFVTLFVQFMSSAYLAGFLSAVLGSLINYVVLKRFVFFVQKAE